MPAMLRPWAILLCRFSDDQNDPAKTRLSDLYAQWKARYGATWLANNLAAEAASDYRTILDLYRTFFMPAGVGTFNAVKYWDDMSHGSIDIGNSQVFPCILDLTQSEGASLAQMPGGFQYQEAIFQKAKIALLAQHGVDWKSYYAVAVSFQSPDYGAQGGWYDGGPGVFMDVRFVRDNGIQAWGQEMGHAFGLDHSRQDGSTADYQDMWDVMSTRNAFSSADPNYGAKGPGLNAWNMRSRQWLDESRVWTTAATADFSSVIALRPLHRRELPGYLCAELPSIAGSGPYLVEFRTARDWDDGISKPAILIHRFEGPIGQFLGTHSYLMKGVAGQLSLSAGGVFAAGTGPSLRLRVVSIDQVNDQATVQVCYASSLKQAPSVHILAPTVASADGSCRVPPFDGAETKFAFLLTDSGCMQAYRALWSVTGAMPVAGSGNDGRTFSIVAADPATLVTVSVTLVFDDGTALTDAYEFRAISKEEAAWRFFLCKIKAEGQFAPIPWWEWDPERLLSIVAGYARPELEVIRARTERIARTLNNLITERLAR